MARKTYTDAFKKKVVNHYIEFGNAPLSAKKFGVASSTVKVWAKKMATAPKREIDVTWTPIASLKESEVEKGSIGVFSPATESPRYTADPVNHPQHYTSHPSGVECIQITEHMNFNLGNAIKYVWRANDKGGVQDLEKAVWYINREIGRLSK